MSHLQTQWQPPVPSLASLPVDRTKTEPKPAFYKLQFGDDITGFSYYVRTLTVMIGRNCDGKGGILPPPDERNLGGPTIPPLESAGLEDIMMEDVMMEDVKPKILEIEGEAVGTSEQGASEAPAGTAVQDAEGRARNEPQVESAAGDGAEEVNGSAVGQVHDLDAEGQVGSSEGAPGPEADMPQQPEPAAPIVSINGEPATTATEDTDSGEATAAKEHSPQPRSLSEDQVEVKVEEDDVVKMSEPSPPEALSRLEGTAEPVPPSDITPVPDGPPSEVEAHNPAPSHDVDPTSASIPFETSPGLDPAALEALALAATSDSPPPPPPPPMRAASNSLEHVDVDLGPLKSVSRNHAKINYLTDLGHFCLEIYGRNGAWVDDRYFVRGSIVPLNQGSQIQIATRIFHFILPPSPDGSPYNTPYESYALEELPYPYNLPAQDVGYQEFYGEGLAGPGPSSAAALATRFPEQYNVFTAPDGHGLGLAMDAHEWLNEWSNGSGSDSDDSDSESDEDDSDEDESEDDDDDEVEEEDEEEDEEEVVKEPPKPIPKIRLKVNRPSKAESELSSASSGEDEKAGTATGKAGVTAKSKAAAKKNTSPPKPPAVTAADAADTVTTPVAAAKQPTKSKKAQAAKAAKAKAAEAAIKDEVMEVDSTVPPSAQPAEEVKDRPPMTLQEHLEAEQAEQHDKTAVKDKEKPKTKQEKTKTTPAKKETKKKIKAAAIAPAAPAPSVTLNAPGAPPVPTLAAVAATTTAPIALAVAAPPQSAPPAPTLASVETLNSVPTPVRPVPPPPVSQAQGPQPGPVAGPVRPPPPPSAAPTTPQAVRPPIPVRPPIISTPSSSNTGTPEPTKPFVLTELIETPGRPGHIQVNVPIPPSGAGPRPPPGPLIGLDAQPFIGPPPLKPTATFATIIHRALLYLPRGRGTLGEVCNWVAGEWEWFRLNIDAGWQNSIRHNLSLNKAFLKVPRIPEDDPESKGSVWIIDPKEGPKFEEKQRKDALKAEGKGKNSDVKREKERIRVEERQKKLREMPHDQQHPHHPHPHVQPHPHAHPHPNQGYQQRPLPANHPHAQAQRPIAASVRPTPRPVSTQSTTGISKGLPAKGKIAVTITPITAALRQKSVIATTDQNGKPLPFTCDGSTLSLDQQTFGHLTADILEKLTVLGPAQAVEVISAWVINKNKQMAAASAGKAGAGAGAGGVGRPPTVRPNGVAQAVRPGVASARPPAVRPAAAGGAAQRPPQATANASAARPPASTTATANSTTAGSAPSTTAPAPAASASTPSTATTTANASAPASAAPAPAPAAGAKGKVFGPAPPGATLTRVIGMIAEVANAKGDVNIVGPNASALLRYIRVVGVDIDLKVADRIWATGVLPPLPMKKAQPVNGKPGGLKPPTTTQGPGSGPPAKVGASPAGVKRKLESPTPTPTPTPTASASGGGAGAKISPTAGSETGGSEVKKAKLETAGA